jgi:hypothetical protein
MRRSRRELRLLRSKGSRKIAPAEMPFRSHLRRSRCPNPNREAFNLDLASVVVRECCWSGDPAAHAYSLDKAMKMYARIRSLEQVAAMLRQ